MAGFQDIRDMFGDRRWPEVATIPAWSDFEQHRLAEDLEATEVVTSAFSRKQPVLVVSPAKRGKTFLVRSVGFRMTENGLETRQINAQYINPNDAIQEIESAAKYDQAFVYFIEDCHRDLGRAGELLQWVCSRKWEQSYFLFTIRGSSIEDLLEPYRSLVEDNNISFIVYQPQETHIRNIIHKFCEAIRSAHINSVFLNPSDEETRDFIVRNHIGSDLERLMRFMKTWEQQCDNLSLEGISEEGVLRLVWNQSRLDDVRTRDVLCTLSVFGQYEIDTEVGFLEELGLSKELQQLGRQQGMVYYNVTAAGHKVTLKEEEDSEWILKAVSRFRPKFSRDEYVCDTVKRYILWGAFNAHRLLAAIALDKNRDPLVEILKDPPALAATKVSLAKQTYTTLLHVLEPINRLVPELGQELSRETPVRKTLIDNTKGASAYRLRKSIRLLAKLMNLSILFTGWTEDDWRSTIDSSSLHTLRLLCYDFQHYRLSSALADLATNVSKTDLEQMLDPNQGATFKELNRFVGNIVRYVSRSTAETFIGDFINKGLTQLIRLGEGADSGDLGWFIRIVAEYTPSKVSRFADNMRARLRSLLETTEMPHRFWLLLELHNAAPVLAASLVETHALKDWIYDESTLFYLASAELQRKCGRDISSIATPTMNSVVKGFNDEMLKDRPNVAILMLVLDATTEIWSKEQRKRFSRQVDLLSVRGRLEDIKLSSNKRRLIERYDSFMAII